MGSFFFKEKTGKIREKMAALLQEAIKGSVIEPADLYRLPVDRYDDMSASWGGKAERLGDYNPETHHPLFEWNQEIRLYGGNAMGDCIKYGFTIEAPKQHRQIDIYANDTKKMVAIRAWRKKQEEDKQTPLPETEAE